MSKLLDPLLRHDSARELFNSFADAETNTIYRDRFDEVHEQIVSSLKISNADEDGNKRTPSASQLATLGITFDDFDRDGDGVLSWAEFVELHNAVLAFQLGANRSSSIVSLASDLHNHEEDDKIRKTKKTRGYVLGDVAFSTAYKLGRRTSAYDTVNISNNTIGLGIIAWIRRFDPEMKMANLIAQNCCLKDRDIRRLATHLSDHPNIKRIDVRGNHFIATASFKALESLAERNSKIVEILLDSKNLSGAPFAAVAAMHKRLGKNRCLLGVHKGQKKGILAKLVLAENNSGTSNDHRANRFQNVGLSEKWTASGLMNGLFAAKNVCKINWAAKVTQAKTQRAHTVDHMQKLADEHSIQLTLHRPSSMNDLRGQGNIDMYSDEALRQRNSLRMHPEIIACSDRWWHCLLIPTFDANSNGKLEQDEYIIFHKCLNMALQAGVEGLGDSQPISPQKATQMALEDWEEDSGGTGTVDSERFKKALFELADMWTETTDVQEYIDFLEFLFSSMSNAMKTFPHLTDSQRQNIQFQVRQQRFLADAKRCKAARLDALGIAHSFDDEMLAKLHRDFEKVCHAEMTDQQPPTYVRSSVVKGTFKNREKAKSDSVAALSCHRQAFYKIMELQGFALDTTTRRLFDMFDMDGSGTIDFRELLFGLNMLTQSADCVQLALRAFKLYDADGTGVLGRVQLASMIAASCKMHGIAVDEQEVQRRLETLLSSAAEDAHLTMDEFVQCVNAYPDLLPLLEPATATRAAGADVPAEVGPDSAICITSRQTSMKTI